MKEIEALVEAHTRQATRCHEAHGAAFGPCVHTNDSRTALLTAIRDREERARRDALEEAIREVNAMKQRNALARDRATAAGRENVASHRQSDVETCEQIDAALRALSEREEG